MKSINVSGKFNFKTLGSLLMLLLLGNYLFANYQSVTQKVTGIVTSAKDSGPLPGATIVVKGTTNGTISDAEGKFAIEAKEGDILQISFISFSSKEVVVTRASMGQIALKEDVASLDEIVAVGYGVQKKSTLTGAVETVKADVFEDRAVTSPALALQGQRPGLVVTRSSSRPGNEDIGFNIRGATSVNGGDPLIVIDGVPSLNKEAFVNMSSDDIESITVLKDASAAIYGSRAANGVILVTTKKGKGGKMTVDFGTNVRMNTIGIRPPTPSMSQFGQIWLEATDEDGQQANYWGWLNRKNLVRMAAGEEGVYETAYWGNAYFGNADRFEELFGSSISFQTNGSISGSTEKTNYRLSLNFAEDEGALKTAYDGRQQVNARLNYDFQITDWLKLETGVSYFQTERSSPSTGLDATAVSFDPPLFPSRNPYGQWHANFNIAGNRNSVAATVDGGRETEKRDQIKLNWATTANIVDGLSFRLTGAYNTDFYQYQMYRVTVPQYTWTGELAPEAVNSTSDIRERMRNVVYQNYGGFLNYEKSFGDHNITGMVGINAELNRDKTLYGYRQGFEDNGIYDLNLGSLENKVEATGGAGHWGFYSYIGRATYNYKQKYLLEGTIRRDGSSKFSPDNRWATFGSVQAGWVITQEDFMENYLDYLSFLKVRASYGTMGNQAGIGQYDYLSSMGNGSAIFGQDANQQNSAWISALTSDNRTWETVKDLTVGLDFGLFEGGKLYGSWSWFQKVNDGMLISINYPEILGGVAPKSNSGTLKTRGWELAVGWKDKIGSDFNYNVSFNISDARNKITSMEGANAWQAGMVGQREGFPINSYFLYETAGYFATEQEVEEYYRNYGGSGIIPSGDNLTTRLRPGDTKVIDRDGNGYISDVGDGVSDAGDVKFMGDDAPHYVYGINLGASYKKWDFSALFQGVLEQNMLRDGYMAYPFRTLYTNQTTAFLGKTWTESNPLADYPRMTGNPDRAEWNWRYNDFRLENNRYMRLKSLTVGYTLRDFSVFNMPINKFRIYFAGNDLFEFTSVKDGYDPEYGDSSNTIYPFTRTWSLGLNLTF